jgi:hypothetical protein
VEAEFLAVVAARTPRHAELLRGTRGARPTPALGYTQHPKTARTAAWIPHGSEHRFTPQEMADVVCAQLLELNADQLARTPAEFDTMLDLIAGDFARATEMINEVRGTSYRPPRMTRSLADVNPALRPGGTGWARMQRQRNGVWVTTNAAEVQGARDAREIWARSGR